MAQGFNRLMKYISTHALTWSATFLKAQLPVRLYDFNSRAHVERDVPTAYMVAENKDFNSRAHVERDGLDWFKNAVM